MYKKIFLLLSILLIINNASADSQSYGSLIQIQSKQIQELKSQVLNLEKELKEFRIALKKSGILINKDEALNVSENPTYDTNLNSNNSTKESLGDQEVAQDETKFVDEVSKDKYDYDIALASLKNGNFETAETQFSDFIKKYPKSLLQSNTTFWYAETFYRRSIFDKAAINYLKSYKEYPKGSKAPDALLKLSYSLGSLNKNKEACSMLTKLEAEFPKRPINSIKRAEEARKKFQCK